MFPDWTVFLSCVFITLSVFCARLLSFLFHLLGEGEQRGEMGDGRGRKGKQIGERTGRVWSGGKWECTKKITPKRNIFATAPCHTFLESSLQGQHFYRR